MKDLYVLMVKGSICNINGFIQQYHGEIDRNPVVSFFDLIY